MEITVKTQDIDIVPALACQAILAVAYALNKLKLKINPRKIILIKST